MKYTVNIAGFFCSSRKLIIVIHTFYALRVRFPHFAISRVCREMTLGALLPARPVTRGLQPCGGGQRVKNVEGNEFSRVSPRATPSCIAIKNNGKSSLMHS